MNLADPMEKSVAMIKTIMIGDANVGKSAILRMFTKGDFGDGYNPTIGLEFESKDIILKLEDNNTKKVTIQIWDTAGQESFRSIVKSFYQNTAAVLLVYDATNLNSFHKLGYWIEQIRQNSSENVCIVLIGNKKDSDQTKVEVTDQMIEDLMKKEKFSHHFFTSALKNLQIEEAFNYVATEVYKNFLSGDTSQKQPGVRQMNRSGYMTRSAALSTSNAGVASRQQQGNIVNDREMLGEQSNIGFSSITSKPAVQEKKKSKCC